MPKAKEKNPPDKGPKDKNNLVGRVKKVIKKSRRKLSEQKFEKELQRTIEFLAQMRVKLSQPPSGKAGKKPNKKAAVNARKKTKATKQPPKKTGGNSAIKKSRKAAPKSKSAAATAIAASPAEMQSSGE
jgi:hypothetical protein